MKKRLVNKKSYLLAFFLLIISNLSAQDTSLLSKNFIACIGKYNGTCNVVRWAPSNAESFYILNKYGYKLEKAQIGKDTQYFKAVWKTVGVFKPADSMVWKKRVDTSNAYQVIAAHCALAKINANLPNKPSFAEIIARVNEESNLHGFAMVAADFDTCAANLLGLRYEDCKVEKDATYAYRITSLAPENVLKINGSETFVQSLLESKIAPPELYAVGYEKHVRLDWYNNLHKVYFTGYYLERGDSKGKNFKRMNKAPMVLANDPKNPREKDQMTFIDSTEKDYVVYSYRLIGIDAFGELSEPGNVVYCYGRDRTAPGSAHTLNFADVNGKAIQLTWKKDEIEKDFVGFNVLRSQSHNGPFYIINDKLLDKKANRFLDTKPDETEGSFYKIETIDTAGNKNWSLGVYGFLKDTIPPSKPKGLRGTVDSNGVVTLRWNLGPELDIKGYRIFFANQSDHELTNLTGELWQDTVFVDSVNINTLTKHIYYQIVAADMHFNHSQRSDLLKIKLPDTVRPVKPVFSNILVTDTAVYLSWVPSSSLDVVKHNIYRKQGDDAFVLWKSIDGNIITNISDRDVLVGQVYTYKIEALDDSNLSSGFPSEVSGKIYDVGKRTPIKNLKVVYNSEKKRLILTWEYPTSNNYYFVIYRSFNNSTFKVYRSVDGTQIKFEDFDIFGAGIYTYAVIAYYKDGGTSGLTEKISITIK